jgi:hypothetical protein
MRTVLALFLVLTAMSCGRRNDNDCRSREHMRIQCQAEQVPSFGRPYALEVCNRTYEADRCY